MTFPKLFRRQMAYKADFSVLVNIPPPTKYSIILPQP